MEYGVTLFSYASRYWVSEHFDHALTFKNTLVWIEQD